MNHSLLNESLPDLLALASARRDESFGTRITYSPKVFIPLTFLCNDTCGYCTFAQPPARVEKLYLDPEDVLKIAKQGARQGCHEALFTLGERPENRYEVARDWLRERGYDSTVHYVAEMAKLVIAETGLLPHANCGALTKAELEQLRPFSPSQGMMIESINPDLEAHRNAPDKVPERRLATLEAAGELQIPFTTGILIGIGDTRADQLAGLEAIADSHRRHGHVQEVIVQNFLPKLRTAMKGVRACPSDDYLWTLAAARLILPADVHLQAPPNLSDDFGALVDAGIDDWGGVSPVTADHVNPERPWPDLDRLREVTEAKGHVLAPRLTVYPEFVRDRVRWLDEGMHFPVIDRADSEWLGRDDPGQFWPEKTTAADTVADGAEFVLVGHRSTAWYSGADHPPPVILSDDPDREQAVCPTGAVADVLDGIEMGQEPGLDEIATLFTARGPEAVSVMELADRRRKEIVGDTLTWVANRNINYTNVCTFKCKFCGFSKGPLSLNLRGTPYLLTLDDIAERAKEGWDAGATEVTLQGGIHPNFDGDYYIDVTRAVKDAVPDMHVHGFTALEVTEGAKRLGEDLVTYLGRLKDAGLASLPGTAAEILDDEIRAILCPDKINTEEWMDAHRAAHSIGLHSNVTIMFGSVEEPIHWARHIVITRELQKENVRLGQVGFTEFVGLPFVHMASPIYLQRKARRGPTFRENVLMHSVARLAYGELIPNIQASWVKIGLSGTHQMMNAGCNDLGGTLMGENISRAAGASHGQEMTVQDFTKFAESIERPVEQRTTGYGRVLV
jgi:FO synthase